MIVASSNAMPIIMVSRNTIAMILFGIIDDDCVNRHLIIPVPAGTPCIKVGDIILHMYFDGWKYFDKLEKPTADDLVKFEIIELISRLKCEPQRLFSRRATPLPTKEVKAWRSRLGFPTYAVTKQL